MVVESLQKVIFPIQLHYGMQEPDFFFALLLGYFWLKGEFLCLEFLSQNWAFTSLDVLVDSLDANNFSVWSLFPLETLISDTIAQSLLTFPRGAVVCLSLFDINFARWLNNSILLGFLHFCSQSHTKYPSSFDQMSRSDYQNANTCSCLIVTCSINRWHSPLSWCVKSVVLHVSSFILPTSLLLDTHLHLIST